LDLGSPPPVSPQPSTNPLFVQAQQGIPSSLPTNRLPEFGTVIAPFTGQVFATGIGQSDPRTRRTPDDLGREAHGEARARGKGEQILDAAAQRPRQAEAQARRGHLFTPLDGHDRLPAHATEIAEGLLGQPGALAVVPDGVLEPVAM